MSESEFVEPNIERLFLVDAAKRIYAALVATGKATPEELAQAADRVETQARKAHWIDVKKELNSGEYRHIFGRLVKTMHFGERAEVNPDQVGLSKVVEYVVGWSLTDKTGAPVPVSESAINNLKGPTYALIVNAVDAWDEAVEAGIDERKNDQGGESASKATSPSPSISVGATSGSVN